MEKEIDEEYANKLHKEHILTLAKMTDEIMHKNHPDKIKMEDPLAWALALLNTYCKVRVFCELRGMDPGCLEENHKRLTDDMLREYRWALMRQMPVNIATELIFRINQCGCDYCRETAKEYARGINSTDPKAKVTTDKIGDKTYKMYELEPRA